MATLGLVRIALLAACAATPAAALAQAGEPSSETRSYTPTDFARFAPKTAYDMLRQVPGFAIRSADQERGLGQASENVLINGQRVTDKSGGAVDQLQRTSIANVERIEVVDASRLGIAGLAGQVANVVLRASRAASRQFQWEPEFRAHFAKPRWYQGMVSYSGASGPLDYTLSVKSNTGRGGFGGDIRIHDAQGVVTERRREIYHSEIENPTFQAKFGLDGPGSSAGNLTLAYTPYWKPVHITDRREFVTGETRARTNVEKLDGWFYDVNADYAFDIGPGRLKLIGLRHFDHEPLVTTQILRFGDGSPAEGQRFSRDTRIGETIGRAEYGWKTGVNDWQVSLERAFNSLDQKGALFELDADGTFQEEDFPQGTGKVTEVRYEAITTLSRPLTAALDVQLAAGGEISRLDRVDDDQPARKFFRPKGSVTLGWRPGGGWDASLKLRRRVGQISFYDFLAQPKLADDRQNAGNPDLVPPQSWEIEGEIGRELGAWGKTRLRSYYHRIDDIIDIIPLSDDTEGVGNLPRATRFGAESTSTIQFDPLGWTGAKIDLTVGFERTRVRDPLTGAMRPISGTRNRWVSLQLRHDISGTPFAWGASANHDHYTKNYFLSEVYRSWEGPWWVGVFVEHKNVFGLTVRADVGNLMNARHRLTRVVYDGWRDGDPIDFIQRNNQLIGPIFSFSVKGNF